MSLLSKKDEAQLLTWSGDKGNAEFELLYQASQHSLSSTEFHRRCDDRGPTFTVMSNTAGYIYGGYTSISWLSKGTYSPDPKAFLFKLKQNNSETYQQFLLKNRAGGPHDIYTNTSYGPTFGGGHDLHTFSNTVNKTGNYWQGASSNLGHTYQFQQAPSDLCNNNMQLTEFEVYCLSYKESKGLLPEGEQWRTIKGWSEKERAEVMKTISSYKPFESLNVPETRILLLGPVTAGKSSFFNTINSAFRGHITAQAGCGSSQHSLTIMFRNYRIRGSIGGPPLAFRLCDTMGLEDDQGLNSADVGYILDGHIPDNFQFNSLARISPKTAGFIKTTSLAQAVHCVLLVIDGSTVGEMGTRMEEKLVSIKEVAMQRGLCMLVLLTKIDQVCSHLAKDVTLAFRSIALRDAVNVAAKKLGLPKNHILPVKNYESETSNSVAVDVLALTALQQILQFSDNYFDEQLDCLEQEKDAKQQSSGTNKNVNI